MSSLPVELPPHLAADLREAFDPEAKIARALEALGPVAGRDVAVVDAAGSPVIEAIRERGARVTHVPASQPLRLPFDEAAVDAVVGLWSAFRGPAPDALAEVDRVLRPEGRLLVVHDYGRDDVSRLFEPDRPEYGAWSQRNGPFLRGGFRVRVVHTFWVFDTLEAAAAFLAAAFGERGEAVASTLRRPRLTYNVAVYHRNRAGGAAPAVDGSMPTPASS
ncbi:MAG TPA: methyltransferase domain-containing protein [Candidatus Limnocylindrales bacterium]